MKKKYIKPDIMFESFALSTSIAAGCEVKTDTQAAMACGYQWGKGQIFLDYVAGCTTDITDGSEEYDSICYHNPFETNNLFNS